MIVVRATVSLPGYPVGWVGPVDETNDQIAYYLDATWMVPADGSTPPPFVPGELQGDVAGPLDANEIQPGVVGSTEIAADAVSAAKIQTGAVGTSELAAESVTAAKISPDGSETQVLGISGGVVDWIDQSGGGGGGDPTMGGDFISGLASDAVIIPHSITANEIATALNDPAAGTPGFRTLGTGATQAAAGSHAHTLNDLSNVTTAGAVSGTSVLGLVGTEWVPVPGGDGAVTLADLSGDIDLTGQADGDYLGRVGGIWTPITPPGAPDVLDDLTDVNAPSPSEGSVLTRSGGQWVALPGASGGVTWMVFPESHGATGDAFAGASVSVGAGAVNTTNPLTMTGASFTTAMATAGYLVIWQTPLGAEIAQVKSRISATQVTLCPVGNTAVFYTAVSTVSALPGCRFNPVDTTAWQLCLTDAKNNGVAIGVAGNKRYGITTDLDASNIKGLAILALGGRPFVANPTSTFPTPVANGSFLLACSTTAITILRCGVADPTLGTDAIAHNGLHLERMGFHDPTFRNIHTGVLARYQTRQRIYDNHYANLATGHRSESGTKDVSWAEFRDNSFMNNTISVDNYNAVWNGGLAAGDAPTGAMANTITGGNFNIMAGQTGILWRGGQYGTIANMKMDQDGVNSCCIRILNGIAYAAHGAFAAGTSPSGGMIVIANIRVEATGPSMSATTPVFDIQTDRVAIQGCMIGGGGGQGGIGIAIGLTGSNVASSVHVVNSVIINRDVCIAFGPKALAGKTIGCRFGGNGMFVRWDAGSQDCHVLNCHGDLGSNPLNDTTRMNMAVGAVRPWVSGLTWNTGGSDIPCFNGVPSNNFGMDGCAALNTATNTIYDKISGVWTAR